MSDTQNLNLPYILAAQAQKHVTHNEALRALDAIVQLAVLDRDLAASPGTPTEGDRYIVASGATGSWSGRDNEIAAWQDGAWAFYQPNEGWIAWVADEDALFGFDGTNWISAGGGGSTTLNPAAGGLVGVNATADTTNRLSMSSAASLFNHDGNGHQQKINKNAAGDTASQLYQTGFSGRAEIGLIGDDDFQFKVSPDGSTWHAAITIDKDNGYVGINRDNPSYPFHVVGLSSNQFAVFEETSGNGVTISATAFNQEVRTTSGNFNFRPITGLTSFYSSDFDAKVQLRTAGYASIAISLNANGTTYFNGGNVAIGKTTADEALDVEGAVRVKSYTVGALPSAANAGSIIYVSDETGGAVLAFSDGTDWRRATDRAIVS